MKRRCNGAAGGPSKRRSADTSVMLTGGEKKSRMAVLWRQEKLCDVQVRVGEKVFPAHRLVLAAESKFLYALFDGHFKESLAPIVDIHELEPHVFALALDFMYDGECAVDASVLEQLLSAASVLQLDTLLATVVAEIAKHVTADNCVSMMACADCHHLPELKTRTEAVAREAFVEVASDPAVPASSMLALLQSDDLNVKTEQEVFETLLKWLKGQADPLDEEQQLALFALVRFPLLSQDFIDSTVMAEPAFSTFLSQKLLFTQFKDIYFGGAKPKPRRPTQVAP